jgi:hypothetical protein
MSTKVLVLLLHHPAGTWTQNSLNNGSRPISKAMGVSNLRPAFQGSTVTPVCFSPGPDRSPGSGCLLIRVCLCSTGIHMHAGEACPCARERIGRNGEVGWTQEVTIPCPAVSCTQVQGATGLSIKLGFLGCFEDVVSR